MHIPLMTRLFHSMIPRPSRHCLLALLTLCLAAAAAPLQAADSARVSVILVEASNSGSEIDSGLRPYAETLQRLFRFASYRQVGARVLSLQMPGIGAVDLPEGMRLQLESAESDGGALRSNLTWTRGNQRLLHTRITLRPGQPALLGGPPSGKGGGTYLLLLELR